LGVFAQGSTEIAALPASAQNAAIGSGDEELRSNARHDPGVAS
jgi:hypothetical protein